MRAVVDTNVIVSAFIREGSPPDQVMQAWRRGAFELVTSPALLTEIADVFPRPKIAGRTGWLPEMSAGFVDELRRKTTVVYPEGEITRINADPDDNRVLEAAVAGHAAYIVSGDGHLLELERHESTDIVTPTRFLAILATEAANP